MAVMGTAGGQRASSANRNLTLATVSFDTNNTSAPDGLVDAGSVVSSVARSGAGVLVVTLAKRWKRVRAFVEHHDSTAAYFAKVTGCTEGSAAANTVTVQIENVGSGAADTTDKQVDLLLCLER